MTLAQYFREKIERQAQFYETHAARIDARYTAQVEKLATRTRDKALAQFFRKTMEPHRVMAAIAHIRALLQSGEIIVADRELERLQTNVQFVDAHLRHRYFKAGAKVSLGGRKSAEARWGPPDERLETEAGMREMFDAKRRQGFRVGEAERDIAKVYRKSARTVRKARSGK
jgi:hypothetical protein